MGLIKAALGAAGGTLQISGKNFSTVMRSNQDTLMIKGQKRTWQNVFQYKRK